MRKTGGVLGVFFLLLIGAASCGDTSERAIQCGLDSMHVCHCHAMGGQLEPSWQPVAGCSNYSCCFLDLDKNNGDCFCAQVFSSDPNSRPLPSGPLPPLECLRRVPVRNARVIDSCPSATTRAR